MDKNTRAFFITINNPSQKEINKLLSEIKCYYKADGIITFTNPIRKSTLFKQFKNSHCKPN